MWFQLLSSSRLITSEILEFEWHHSAVLPYSSRTRLLYHFIGCGTIPSWSFPTEVAPADQEKFFTERHSDKPLAAHTHKQVRDRWCNSRINGIQARYWQCLFQTGNQTKLLNQNHFTCLSSSSHSNVSAWLDAWEILQPHSWVKISHQSQTQMFWVKLCKGSEEELKFTFVFMTLKSF